MRILVRMMFLKAFNFLIVTIERAKTMSNHLELLGMDHDDDSFDNDRDDWQDDLVGCGNTSLGPDELFWAAATGIGLGVLCVVSTVIVICLMAVEVWRMVTNG